MVTSGPATTKGNRHHSTYRPNPFNEAWDQRIQIGAVLSHSPSIAPLPAGDSGCGPRVNDPAACESLRSSDEAPP